MVRPPEGWITLRDVAVAEELGHYPRLIARLCRLAPRLLVRTYRGSPCLRYRELAELHERLDRWRSEPKWTRFARRIRRRRRAA
jgi:hypothetical protein